MRILLLLLLLSATASAQQATQLADWKCTGPEPYPGCRAIADFSGMVYDTKRHQILMFGGGHATVFTDAVLKFDFGTMSWSEDYPHSPCSTMVLANQDVPLKAWMLGPAGPYPRPMSRHTYDKTQIVGDELIINNEVHEDNVRYCKNPIKKGPSKIAHYNIITKTWTFSSVDSFLRFAGGEVDPKTQNILYVNSYGAQVYNPASRTKRVLDSKVRQIGYDNAMVYYPPTDVFYYFTLAGPDNRVKLFKITPARAADVDAVLAITVDPVAVTGDIPTNHRGYDFDSKRGLIGGGVENNTFYAFDPKTDTWLSKKITGAQPGKSAFHALVYDPVGDQYIFWATNRNSYSFRWESPTIPPREPRLNVPPLTLAQAAQQAMAGDRIEIAAGDYPDQPVTWAANDLVIVGVGGKARVSTTGLIANEKAIWITKGNNITIDNIEFSGAKVKDKNGAGIRAEGVNLTVRNSRFVNNENGILGGRGTILIEHSEFENNGHGDGQSHNLYIGNADALVFRFNRSVHARVGHTLKSRAASNQILNSYFEESANTSYGIDISEGGRAWIIGNTLVQRRGAINNGMVTYGAEGMKYPNNSLQIMKNTFINDHDKGVFVFLHKDGSATVSDNTFLGVGTISPHATVLNNAWVQ